MMHSIYLLFYLVHVSLQAPPSHFGRFHQKTFVRSFLEFCVLLKLLSKWWSTLGLSTGWICVFSIFPLYQILFFWIDV